MNLLQQSLPYSAPDAALAGEEGMQIATFVRDLEGDACFSIHLTQPCLELGRLGADLAREKSVLREQQIVVVVVEIHRHAVVGKHQERQRARTNFIVGHDMAHDGLKKRLVRNPGGLEKPHHVFAFAGESHHRLYGLAAQAPPLAADLDLQVRRNVARQTKAFLQLEHAVEPLFLGALVEPVTVDQPLFLPAGLDPVAFEVVKAFDEIDVVIIKVVVDVFGGFDCHAIARQHVEVCGTRKGINRAFNGVQRCLHQRPFSPTAADAFACEGHIGVLAKRLGDLCEIGRAGRGVKVDRHVIARRRQSLRLLDDCNGVFVTQKDIGNSGHRETRIPSALDEFVR